MSRFEINILGCGAATPTLRHFPTAQVVNVRDKLYMVDCGEGAQLNWRRTHLNLNRLGHIFISHLHGDHCFGLPGLISTMGLLGHTGDLVIHAHPDAQRIFKPMLEYFCREMPFDVRFNPVSASTADVIYCDRSLSVRAIPLKHRIPACGFLFEEKEAERHLRGDMLAFYDVPLYRRNEIRQGADYVLPDGQIIPNDVFTLPPTPPARYAYCSDTVYSEAILPYIEGVDLLYHEATYADSEAVQARKNGHSTARQAGMLARQANVKQLLIGHFSPRYNDENLLLDEARQEFPCTELAYEGLNWVLRR